VEWGNDDERICDDPGTFLIITMLGAILSYVTSQQSNVFQASREARIDMFFVNVLAIYFKRFPEFLLAGSIIKAWIDNKQGVQYNKVILYLLTLDIVFSFVGYFFLNLTYGRSKYDTAMGTFKDTPVLNLFIFFYRTLEDYPSDILS
jgi:hypothetical protein